MELADHVHDGGRRRLDDLLVLVGEEADELGEHGDGVGLEVVRQVDAQLAHRQHRRLARVRRLLGLRVDRLGQRRDDAVRSERGRAEGAGGGALG
eukprot:5972475-Prymnesium_polylepis.1